MLFFPLLSGRCLTQGQAEKCLKNLIYNIKKVVVVKPWVGVVAGWYVIAAWIYGALGVVCANEMWC